jgi:predicted nucleic acid-binding Zn ribbon protein
MKKREAVQIKNVVESVIRKLEKRASSLASELKAPGRWDEENALREWERAAGKKISLHTRASRIKDAVLIVNVDSSNWLFELQTKHKARILKKLKKNTRLPEIKDIKFRLGDIEDGS